MDLKKEGVDGMRGKMVRKAALGIGKIIGKSDSIRSSVFTEKDVLKEEHGTCKTNLKKQIELSNARVASSRSSIY